MRTKFVIALFIGVSILSACSFNENKMFDEKHKSIYINGVSAIEGKDAVIASLVNNGFELDEHLLDTTEQDYPKIGRFVNHHPKKKQFDLIFWNILDGLEYDSSRIGVSLVWYKSGTIKSCSIYTGEIHHDMPKESVAQINKRLTERFEHSKIGNKSAGYKIYYNDSGVSLYYPNDNGFQIELYDK